MFVVGAWNRRLYVFPCESLIACLNRWAGRSKERFARDTPKRAANHARKEEQRTTEAEKPAFSREDRAQNMPAFILQDAACRRLVPVAIVLPVRAYSHIGQCCLPHRRTPLSARLHVFLKRRRAVAQFLAGLFVEKRLAGLPAEGCHPFQQFRIRVASRRP